MLSALIRRSLKCSNLLDAILRRIRPSRGFMRVDVRRKPMTVNSANNCPLVTGVLNPNGNYVTMSSEIVTFLESSEKESQKPFREIGATPRAAFQRTNQTKYLLPDNRPF